LKIYENATQQFLSGAVINLLKNNVYVFTCSAYSNPDVSLILYDTNTNKLLSTQNNTISSLNCDSYGKGCTSNISVSLDFGNIQFENLTSVTCESKSLNPNISLTANSNQRVVVSPTSILKNV
jgi:hypothetical protein